MPPNRLYETSVVVIVLKLTSVFCGFPDFDVDPPQGICYETYEVKNALSCQEPRRVDMISCLEPLKDRNTYGLVTPTNETVLFVPPYYNNDNCFDVYKEDNMKKVCTKLEPHGISVTTPEKYTIWLSAVKCNSVITKEDLGDDRKFVSNFHFDYEERSCYKIYSANEKISPYTCAEVNTAELCVKEIDNCSILATPNEETVNLGCTNDTNAKNNCVEVFSNSTRQKLCLEKLEERCVGFTVPSGLRILVACRECFHDFFMVSTHNSSLWKQHRAYIKRYLSEEHQSNHLHINKEQDIYKNANIYRYPLKQYSCFDARSNCYLLTLNSNETVYIHCRNRSDEQPGCYKVVDQETGKENSACVRVIDEKCVGIITPKNTLIMLECFEEFLEQKRIDAFLHEELMGYVEGRFLYPRNRYLYMFKNDYHDEVCHTLHEQYKNGSMITTLDNETLNVQDPIKKNANGDYTLYDSSSATSSVRTVHLQRVDHRCLGITTPKGWNIVFVCYYPATSSAPAAGVFQVKTKEPTNMF